LLLDEPTVGLDPIATQDFYRRIEQLKEQGCTVILCSHVLPGVEKYIDRALILGRGKLLAEGSVNDLRQQAADIAALEDMLAFYRAVLAPEEADAPVVIRPPELVKLGDASRWRLSAVVHRSEEGDAVYRGQFSVVVRGEGPGEPVLSPLGEVDSATASGVFPLRFRYLQELQVVISLPEAFLPETIESVVTLTGPVRRTLRRSDRWQDLVTSGLDPQL